MVDPIQFKLDVAQKYLAKIPDRIPKNATQQAKMEENAQAFLFFASGVIELLKRKINDKFKIFDPDNVFYIYGLQKNLKNSGAQKAVKRQILDYFSTPKITPKINHSKSNLWRLQALRNQAMHGNIIKVSGQYIEFTYNMHQGEGHSQFGQRTKTPHRYFGQLLQSINRFTTETLTLLEKSA